MHQLRKVSSFELSMATYGTIVTAFTLTSKTNLEWLQHAIAIEAKRHPLLNTHIIFQDDNYFFETIQQEFSIDIMTGKKDIYDALINQELDISQQLGKIIVLASTHKTYIYFCVSHVISDAKSSICFIENCLNHYEQLTLGKIFQPNTLPILTDIGDLIKKQVPNISLFDFRKLHTSLTNIKKLSPSDADCKAQSQCHNKIKTLIFNSNELERLRTYAKKHQTTLNALISTAILFALKKLPTTQGKNFSLTTAINLRQWLPQPISNEHLIMAVCGQITLEALDKSFEDTAKKISDDIEATIRSDAIFNMVYSHGLRKITNPHQLDWHQNSSSITISNVGNLGNKKHFNKITIEDIRFSVTRFDGQPYINMLTFNHSLHLNIAYPYPRFSDDLIDQLSHNILSSLT